MIDAAIHYANTRLQSDALPNTAIYGAERDPQPCAVRQRQAALDRLAKKLARPEMQ